ncbi:hypothetical protein BKA93DRAFT_814438 [Sparassis latifolia]
MANVVTHPYLQVDFHRGLVNHSPSPLGFGFGLSTNMPGWSTTPISASPSPWTFPAIQSIQPRTAKRRHEPEEESENKHLDDAMDRSPTPERPKRAAPKRARTTAAAATTGREDKLSKENKPPSATDEDDVDVGVLLASLPSDSLLPLLTSLLSSQPSLKSTVLSLIPRPTIDTAVQALANSAKKLRDAYPYSSTPFSTPSTSYGFSSGAFANSRHPHASSTGFGFGRGPPAPVFSPHAGHHSGGMRDEYILSRLRPHITEFVSACLAYLPYFSYVAVQVPFLSSSNPHHTHASALQSQHRDKSHPSETFLYLSTVTSQFLSQPPLTQSALVPLIFPRLTEEWKAWVDRVDQVVNREGGMFGEETVRSWERALDEFAEAKGNGIESMRDIRDQWVQKVGWLVGRQPMEEEL